MREGRVVFIPPAELTDAMLTTIYGGEGWLQ
jgi:hypothetical protein